MSQSEALLSNKRRVSAALLLPVAGTAVFTLGACGSTEVIPATHTAVESRLPFTNDKPLHKGERSPVVRTFLSDLGAAGCSGIKAGADTLDDSTWKVVNRFRSNAGISEASDVVGTDTAKVINDTKLFKDTDSCGYAFNVSALIPGCYGTEVAGGKLVSDGRLVVSAGMISDPKLCALNPVERFEANAHAVAGGAR